MIDAALRILDEPPVYLPEVALRYRIHQETAARWVRTGLLINGKRIRLEAIKLGRWRTSEAALGRFVTAIREAQVETAEHDLVAA